MPMDWNVENIVGQAIVVTDLFKATKPTIIEGKTFRDCTLIGPANVFLTGIVNIEDTNFNNCDFVCVKVPAQISTAIVLRKEMRTSLAVVWSDH